MGDRTYSLEAVQHSNLLAAVFPQAAAHRLNVCHLPSSITVSTGSSERLKRWQTCSSSRLLEFCCELIPVRFALEVKSHPSERTTRAARQKLPGWLHRIVASFGLLKCQRCATRCPTAMSRGKEMTERWGDDRRFPMQRCRLADSHQSGSQCINISMKVATHAIW